MIKKKSEAYKLIKDNITKLAIIQESTQYSPTRLMSYFLKYHKSENQPNTSVSMTEEEFQSRFTTSTSMNEEEFQSRFLAQKSAYKYFNKHLNNYLRLHGQSSAHQLVRELLENYFLTADYFGISYEDLSKRYRQSEQWVKTFIKEAYESMFPITPDMTPSQIGARNQKIGKVCVRSYIGDLVSYSYFRDAPNFMIADVEFALAAIDIFIARLLTDRDLDHQIQKLQVNNNLEVKLAPRQTPKIKVAKI